MGGQDRQGAGLLELLLEEPENLEPYLVLSDWLRERGDPRGELIDLHHRGSQNADSYIASHATALLGPLARYSPDDVRLTWRLGFIESARVTILGADSACAAVGALIGHESGRLLRSLTVKLLKKNEYHLIEQVLVNAPARPPLRELTLGNPSQHCPSPELVEAYPHLARPLEELVADAQAAVDGEKRLRLRFLSSALPRPAGAPISARDALLGLRMEVEKKKDVPMIRALRACCPGDLGDAYACELLALFEAEGEAPQHKWLLDAAAAFGGPRFALRVGARIDRWSHGRATQAIEGLAGIRDPVAVYELFAAANHGGKRGKEAARLLRMKASASETTVDGLIGRALEKPVAAEASSRIAELDERWLLSLMLRGVVFDRHDFEEMFVHSPRRARCERLVWAAYNAGRVDCFGIGAFNSLEVGPATRFGVPYINELRSEKAVAVAESIASPMPGQLDRRWLLEDRPNGTLADVAIATESCLGATLHSARLPAVGFEDASSYHGRVASTVARSRTFSYRGERFDMIVAESEDGVAIRSSLGHNAQHPLPVLNELLLAIAQAAIAPQDAGYPRFDRTTEARGCAVCGVYVESGADAWQLQRWSWEGERGTRPVHPTCASRCLELRYLVGPT